MIWFLLACITCTFFFFLSPIPLYPSSLSGPSPPQPNSLHRDVLELHGLQHFVLNSDLNLHGVLYKANRDRPQGVPVHDHAQNDDDNGDGVPDPEHERLDPAKEIDLKVYSSFDGDDDWVKHVRELQNNSPLVVFSKVQSSLSLRCSNPKLCVAVADGRAHYATIHGFRPEISFGRLSVYISLRFLGETRS